LSTADPCDAVFNIIVFHLLFISCQLISSHVLPYPVDPEDILPDKVQAKSSGNVLPYVGVACLGAILFGYHLGYVPFFN
jgi:hypothetical protein